MAKITASMMQEIFTAIGGNENVIKCGNCMTRLRLTLKNDSLADRDSIKRIAGVMGLVESDDQFQIVLGPGKAQTAAEMMNNMLDNDQVDEAEVPKKNTDLKDVASAHKQQLKKKQTSAAQRFLSKFATIFTPLIPGFIAAGLLLGIATLLEQLFVTGQASPNAHLLDLIAYMKVFSKGLFSFLSILIGYNAQQAFGGSGVNGAILASLFVLGYNPDATSGIFSGMNDFFGNSIDPRGNIIGVLIAAIIGAGVEKKVRQFIPDNLDMILTSMILTSMITLLLWGQ